MRAVLMPVKSFREAKLRLSPVLGPAARGELARRLAGLVLAAAGDCPVYVACDDDEVANWAIGEGAFVLFTPGLGLSGAVTAGVEHLGRDGFELVTVAHADLPFAYGLDDLGRAGEVTLVPDRRLDGTPIAAVPANSGFSFAYGPGSFARHQKEAARLGLRCRILHDWRLASDIDNPRDLSLLEGRVGFEGLDQPAPGDEHAIVIGPGGERP